MGGGEGVVGGEGCDGRWGGWEGVMGGGESVKGVMGGGGCDGRWRVWWEVGRR